MVSELVTNAVVHGDGGIEVQLSANGPEMRLDVLDEGDGSPTVRPRNHGRSGGWGLHLVGEVADTWGSETGPGSTRVWMVKQAGAA